MRPTRSMLTCCFGVFILTQAPSWSAAATAQPTHEPDSAVIERLRLELSASQPVRLSGSFGRIESSSISVAEGGIHFGDAFLLGQNQSKLPDSPVAWSAIEAVDVAKTSMARGAVIGTVAGLVMGGLWNSVNPPKSRVGFLQWGPTANSVALGRMLLSVGVGAAVGASVGYAFKRWNRVYP